MNHGRNSPILVSADVSVSETVQCVVKLPWKLQCSTPLAYVLEWVSSALAIRLGLPTPKPHEIELPNQFIQRLPEKFRPSSPQAPVVFGSEKAAVGWGQPMKDQLNIEQVRAATELLAFDVLIQNPDRRKDKPNLFASHNSFLAYDHEMAFSFLFLFGDQSGAGRDPCLEIVRDHFFYSLLRGRVLNIQRFQSELQSISDQEIDDLAALTPIVWNTGSIPGILNTLKGFLKNRRNSFAQWWKEVEACINP
jgi:hypothetical protein